MGASDFRRDIEGLRAVAVVLVLLFHAGVPGFGGGYVGVDVFFVLSGYLITQSLVREAEGSGRIRFGDFFARRFRRLLPAAALVLASTAAAVRLLLPPTMWRDFGGDIVAASLYVSNWVFLGRSVDYLAEDVVPSPVLHFWSLSIEEQYYAIWPLLIVASLAVGRRLRWRLRRSALVLLLALIVVPSFVYAQYRTTVDPAAAFFDTGTRLWELGFGAIAALVPRARLASSAVLGALRVVAVAVLLAATLVVAPNVAWPGVAALLVIAPTAFLVWSGPARSAVDGVLALSPMQWLGARSYSLYLWHWPPLAIAGAMLDGLTVRAAVVITLLSMVPAALAYTYVENPARHAPRLRRSTALSLSLGGNLTAIAALAGVVVLLASFSASSAELDVGASSSGPGQAASNATTLPFGLARDDQDVAAQLVGVAQLVPSPVDATSDLPRIYDDGCQVPFGTSEPVVCEYGHPDGEVRIALVGDSKANQWSSALIDVAERRGWSLSSITKSACELSTAMPSRQGEPYEDCLDWSAEVLELVQDGEFDVVLVSQGSSSAHAADPEERRSLIVEGMADAYRQIEAAGSRVIILMDNHYPNITVYECVAENRADMRPCMFERNEASGGRPAQTRVAEQGYRVIDMSDWICPSARCLPVIDGVLVYRQGSHLTATIVDRLAPVLESRLVAAGDL